MSRLGERGGWLTGAAAVAACVLLVAAPVAGASKAKLAIYNVTLGLTGEASEVGSGMCPPDTEPLGTVCEVNDHATFHVDEEFRDAIFVTGKGHARFALPTDAGGFRHVVNGSADEMGKAYEVVGEETQLQPFACSTSLRATVPDADASHQLSWRHRHGSYQFTAETESYGFEGVASGSGKCNGEGWFGNGLVLYPPESHARFTISASEIGRRSFTKTVGSDPAHSTCGSKNSDTGSCSYTWSWHAVVKFERKRLSPL